MEGELVMDLVTEIVGVIEWVTEMDFVSDKVGDAELEKLVLLVTEGVFEGPRLATTLTASAVT
jgi:hypothetical protein